MSGNTSLAAVYRAVLAVLPSALLSALALALLLPTPSQGQAPKRVWRLAYLDQGSAGTNQRYLDGLRQGLRERGWVEGGNIVIEVRFAEGVTDRLPGLAAQLVDLGVDLIVTSTTPAALAAKQATATIPIVFGFAADPVGSRIVPSLAHPGANVTGWTHQGLELRAKYLELLKEAVPDATRFGVLWNPANQVHGPSLKVIEAAAERLGVEVYPVGVRDPNELEASVPALAQRGAQALVVFPDGMFLAHAKQIGVLAAQRRLPAMYGLREHVEAGGLMSYGANLAEMHRQLSAALVDKILRGAKPADLPVAQPTKFELVINLESAVAQGLRIPQSMLLRADEVIE